MIGEPSTDADPPAPGVRADVIRLDPRTDGRLFEQIVGGDWRLRDGQGCRPWLPEQDRKLPLARALAGLRERADVRVLAYRPERRLTVWLTDESGSRVIKGGRRSRLDRAVERHRWVAAALADGPVGFPRLLEVDGQHAALAMEALEGRPFDLGGHAEPGCFPLGVALGQLQRAAPLSDLPRHDAARELEVLDGLATTVERAGVAVPPSWAGLRQGLPVPASVSAGGLLLPAHRDLHDGQVIVSERRLWLLDVDLLCLADPLLDAANLIAHVKLRELQGLVGADEHSVGRCGRDLLDGLDREGEADARRRLRFYQAATFLRLALVYALRPPWRHLSRELLELARRCRREL